MSHGALSIPTYSLVENTVMAVAADSHRYFLNPDGRATDNRLAP